MWASLRGASKYFLVVVLSFSSASCGKSNMLESFANDKDDPSLYEAALKYINNGYYSHAVEACEEMSGSYKIGEARFVCASAYAGLCGYELLDGAMILQGYFTANPDPATANPKILSFLMTQYNGSTATHMAACENASVILSAGGTAPNRTNDENFMYILMGMTQMGVILNALADTDDDGAPDPAFDHCSDTDFPETNVAELGRAFWNIYRSGEALNSPLATSLVTALDSVSDEIDNLDPSYNFLSSSANPNSYTANQLKMIRAMVAEGDYAGIGASCANIAACFLACP